MDWFCQLWPGLPWAMQAVHGPPVGTGQLMSSRRGEPVDGAASIVLRKMPWSMAIRRYVNEYFSKHLSICGHRRTSRLQSYRRTLMRRTSNLYDGLLLPMLNERELKC